MSDPDGSEVVEAHGGPYRLPGGYGCIVAADRLRIKDYDAY